MYLGTLCRHSALRSNKSEIKLLLILHLEVIDASLFTKRNQLLWNLTLYSKNQGHGKFQNSQEKDAEELLLNNNSKEQTEND